jgi:tetratricopeptide (TPR) repeat protein
LAAVFFLLAGLLCATVARADEKEDELRTAFNEAEKLREKGEYPKALKQYQRALELAPQVFGPDHEKTATILNNLAVLYQNMGQRANAEPLFKRSLQIREAKLGRDHLAVADTLNNLAGLYRDMGQVAKAEPLLKRSLQIYEANLGQDHLRVAPILNNLAALYLGMGLLTKAEPLLQRSLEIYEAKLGRDHPKVAETLNSLAILYQNMGQLAKAEPLYRRSLEIREDKLGRDHLFVAGTLNNLAALYFSMGQWAKAEPLLKRSVKIYEAKLGQDHPFVADTLNNLAALYLRMGHWAKAEPLFKRSLEIREAKLGRDHPKVAETLNNLGSLYRDMGQVAKAKPLLKRSLQIYEANPAQDHLSVARILDNLAGLYWGMGLLTKAEPLLQRSLEIYEAKLGRDHPDIALGLTNLAWLRADQGRWGEAGELADRERRQARRYATGILSALSEEEQLNFLNHVDQRHLHLSLSLGLAAGGNGDITKRSASWLLNGKGVAEQALGERAQLARAGTDPATGKLAKQLLQVRRQLATLTLGPHKSEQAQERQQQLAKLGKREYELSKELGRTTGRAATANLWVEMEEVSNSLPADGVLVEIAGLNVINFHARGGDKKSLGIRYAAWVIPPGDTGDMCIVDLGEAAKIEQAVMAVRQCLQRAQGDSERKSRIFQAGEPAAEKELAGPLKDLSRLVLEPLLPHIADKKEWIISPDAALWLVPWAALPVDNEHYAIETHAIRYVVSGRYLVEPSAKIQPGKPLVMADPDYDLGLQVARAETEKLLKGELRGVGGRLSGGRLPERVRRLLGTAAEAQAIKPSLERWASDKARIYTDKQALEGVFKECHSPKAVVLSTHGFFLEDQEVALAPGLGSRGLELVETSSVKPPVLTKEGKAAGEPVTTLRVALGRLQPSRSDKGRG